MASAALAGAGEQKGDEEKGGSWLGRRRPPPLSAQSAFSYIPPRREGPAELSYFHRAAQTGEVSTYDSIFKRPEGYNEKLHRCDREHARSRGLNVNDEHRNNTYIRTHAEAEDVKKKDEVQPLCVNGLETAVD
ncbi:uncharacterized protein C5orf49 homolog isoform X2 [Numida meleagris]|uniref:uncharacterized protein C5orf49 homolog isoform X2 n=1 Tax=Numida meleagris TaxID=8996 RepID=UPI000B3DA95F|nr:uncharacterized protein C5orf49 homolog isoform X2 [Numida meleagris]